MVYFIDSQIEFTMKIERVWQCETANDKVYINDWRAQNNVNEITRFLSVFYLIVAPLFSYH